MIGKRRILKLDLKKSKGVKREDAVAVDKPVNLFVNGSPFVTLVATPRNVKELAVGHLLGEGAIGSLEDVERIRTRGMKVEVKTGDGVQPEIAKFVKIIPTACGSSDDLVALRGKSGALKAKSKQKFKAEVISGAFKAITAAAKVFKRTGGTHVAALFDASGDMKFAMEDVGRHNAVDKVIGRGAIQDADFSKCFMAVSGRLSADIVLKCARAGIPLVSSKAAALESGVLAAEMCGLTLVGFARGGRMNVYANPERVVM